MKNKLIWFCFLIFLFSGWSRPLTAQIQLGGLADFEFRIAGDDSSPYINQTPGSKFSIYTPYVRLFMSGNVSDKWFVSSVLQADHYEGKALSTPFFSVLNLNYAPNAESDLLFTMGRFITPYGAYSERVLSADNPFVHLPLTHASGLPISKKLGFLSSVNYDPALIAKVYGEEEKGLNMVYQRMYTQGIMISGTIGEQEWLGYQGGLTLAPASSHLEYGEYDQPAITGRITFKPFIWSTLGLNYSAGSFLKNMTANDTLLVYDRSSYKQELFGLDLALSYWYYSLLIEYHQSTWKAPYYDPQTSTSLNRRTGKASISHYSAEAKVNLPFLVGAYIATRYERLQSGDIRVYVKDVSDTTYTWTYDRDRIEFAAGYKLDKNLLFKASYLYSDDSGPDLDDNVLTLQFSVLF